MAGLVKTVQDDFSAGAFPSVAHELVPDNGLTDAINALISDDGLPYRRGGSAYKSNANFGAGGLRFLWDGYLAGGQRTVFADATHWGVLAVDDTTPTDLGTAIHFTDPSKAASMNGMLFFPGGAIYGGSRKTSAVSIAGEVIVANEGSPIVQTANPPTTPWNSGSIDVGMLLRLKTGLGDHRYYAVKSIDNDHQVTLASPYLGPSFVDFIDFEFVPVGSLSQVATIYFVAGNRLIACDGDRAYESNIGDPNTFTADEYQRVPAGAQILGGEGIRDTGLLFTTAGVWAIGNLAFRLTDANGSMQQRFEQVSRDLIVWSWPGITQWGTRLIVPAVDGVWLVDSISAPERITTGLDELYRSYVDAGHHTGIAAVFNNHYFLPILDSSNALIDLLVCRLAPTRRGHAFGWTRFSGDGATVSALAVRAATTTARQPALLGAHRTNGRVLRLPYHIPSATDADASAFQMELVSRQWFSGNLVKNFVAKIRARIASTGTTAAAWQEEDGGWTSLSPDAAAATLTGEPAKWNVGKLRRAIRFRLRSSGPFVLHSLEVFIRQSGRQ